MRQSKDVFWLNATVVAGLWLAILIFFNLANANKFQRWDLNEEQVFTLSPVTVESLEKLSERVTVTFYLSERALPRTAAYNTLRQDVTDLLEEFRSAAPEGRFVFDIVDPLEGRRTITDKEAKEFRDKQALLTSREEVTSAGGKVERFRFISALRVRYSNKREIINHLTQVGTLEYELTRAIRKLTAESLPKVAYYSSNQRFSLSASSKLKRILEQVVDVEEIELGGDPKAEAPPRELYEIDEDIDVLMLVRPRNLDPKAAFAIDQFLMRGGRLVLLLESNDENITGGRFGRRTQEMIQINTGLEDLLTHYGLRQKKSYVFDMADPFIQKEIKPVVVGGDVVITEEETPFPFVFRTQRARHNPRFPMVEQLDSLFLMIASPLEQSPQKAEDITYTWLVRSSELSWEANLPSPQRLWQDFDDESKVAETRIGAAQKANGGAGYDLVALLEGKFKSYYGEGRELPEWTTVVAKWKELKRKAMAEASKEDEAKDPADADKDGEGDAPEKDAPKKDAPKKDAPKKDAPKPDAPKPDAPKKDAPKKDAPKKDAPKKDAPKKDAPKKDAPEQQPKAPKIDIPEPEAPERKVVCDAPNRILVVGDTDLVTDLLIEWEQQGTNHNARFMKNIVEWVAADERLAKLQSKRGRVRPLDAEKVADWKPLLILGMVGLAPLLVVMVGLVVWQLRRSELEEFERRVRVDHGETELRT